MTGAEAGASPDAGGFAAATGEREACGPLLDRAQECLAFERERADMGEAALAELMLRLRDVIVLEVAAEQERIRALAVKHGAVCVCRCGIGGLGSEEPAHTRLFADLLGEPAPDAPDAAPGNPAGPEPRGDRGEAPGA